MPDAWAFRNCRHVADARRGAGPPGGGQDPADRPLPHPVPQPVHLALDAPVSPARVLPRQALHQRPHFIRDRRASRRARIGPFSTDQATVPGQQGSRGHYPVQPQPTWQQPGQGGEHGTVSPVQPRAGDLTTKHHDLMPEDQDLRVLGSVTARQEHHPAEHPDHEEVNETDKHERRA